MINKNKTLNIEEELTDKLWYLRHLDLREQISNHDVLLIEKWDKEYDAQSFCSKDIWNRALKCATKMEKKYGKENLIPDDDIEFGMLMGKLSAIRWVLYGEWDDLDT